MEPHLHSMTHLFAQLGLPSDNAGIRHFIAAHRPLPPATRLADARFWNAGQADFLREGLLGDADWSNVIDTFDGALRQPGR